VRRGIRLLMTIATTAVVAVAFRASLQPQTTDAPGAPRLVLITCGGRFDPVARSYEDNIVVYAEPV